MMSTLSNALSIAIIRLPKPLVQSHEFTRYKLIPYASHAMKGAISFARDAEIHGISRSVLWIAWLVRSMSSTEYTVMNLLSWYVRFGSSTRQQSSRKYSQIFVIFSIFFHEILIFLKRLEYNLF